MKKKTAQLFSSLSPHSLERRNKKKTHDLLPPPQKNFKLSQTLNFHKGLDPLHRHRREGPRRPPRAPPHDLPQPAARREGKRQAAQGRRRGGREGSRRLSGAQAQRRAGREGHARRARPVPEAADGQVDALQAAVLELERERGRARQELRGARGGAALPRAVAAVVGAAARVCEKGLFRLAPSEPRPAARGPRRRLRHGEAGGPRGAGGFRGVQARVEQEERREVGPQLREGGKESEFFFLRSFFFFFFFFFFALQAKRDCCAFLFQPPNSFYLYLYPSKHTQHSNNL